MTTHKNALIPGDREFAQRESEEVKEERERNLDKTIEDTFPASDPLSTIPDPDDGEDDAA